MLEGVRQADANEIPLGYAPAEGVRIRSYEWFGASIRNLVPETKYMTPSGGRLY